jgi:small subunit ribosomal protein S29
MVCRLKTGLVNAFGHPYADFDFLAQDIAIGHTAYQPSPDGKTYVQPEYTATLLANIANGNQKVLSSLKLSQKHDLPIPIQSNISLDRFAELGARDPKIAWPIYVALLKELTLPSTPGAQRPALLLTMDVADHIMSNSGYLNSDAKPIHSHDLAIVSHYLSYLSGSTSLPNGGLVLAAVSESNAKRSPTLSHVVATAYGDQTSWSEPAWNPHAGWEAPRKPSWDPYAPFDQRVADALTGVEMWKLQGLSKEEARGVMEYYALSGMLRREVTDRLVSEKWTLSGGGIFGELERGAVRARI